MIDQAERGRRFRALHDTDTTFVMANAWDRGSARILAGLGFPALATTSAGMAAALGRSDGEIPLAAVLSHCRELCEMTPCPVSADLEDGFAASEEGVAETVRLAAETGLAGLSIEDWTPGRDGGEAGLYDAARAEARVAAAVAAARALPFPFTITARCENFLRGNPDIDDTIARLLRYQDAGADVLYAPMLGSRKDIAEVLRAIDRPLNVLMDGPGSGLSVPELADLGVRRVSLGSAFALAALGGLVRAAREVAEQGTFSFSADAAGSGEVAALMREGAEKT